MPATSATTNTKGNQSRRNSNESGIEIDLIRQRVREKLGWRVRQTIRREFGQCVYEANKSLIERIIAENEHRCVEDLVKNNKNRKHIRI